MGDVVRLAVAATVRLILRRTDLVSNPSGFLEARVSTAEETGSLIHSALGILARRKSVKS